MILVIDGYNLLHEIQKHQLASESELYHFLKKISNYGVIKNHQILVIFDGYDRFDLYRHSYKNLSIRFSKDITADDYIKDYLYGNRSKELGVVSSDLEIFREAQKLKVVTIKSSAFVTLLKQTHEEVSKNPKNKLTGQIYKISEEENPELDKLMEEASNMSYYKVEEDASKHNQSTEKKLSKNERKLLKITKKL